MATINDFKRMCKTMPMCADCPLYTGNISCSIPSKLPDNINEIINKWVAEHPIKTYAMDFFEKFPNAPRNGYGVPKVCLKDVYGDKTHCSFLYSSCTECWNREMKNI